MKILPDHCKLFLTALLTAAFFLPRPVPAAPPQAPLAAKRMNTLGSENARLAQRVGSWDVTETVWAKPGAVPTRNHYRVERTMIGSSFQEIAHAVPGAADPGFRRIFYLSFNRVEGRWKYVSMVTNSPVGLRPAASFGPSENGKIHLVCEPFALAGPGKTVSGQMLRMAEIMTFTDASHDHAEERFMLADGSGKMWTAFRYDYVRRGASSR